MIHKCLVVLAWISLIPSSFCHGMEFRHYQADNRYLLVDLPLHSVVLTRFTSDRPVTITEISIWLINRGSSSGSVDVVVYGNEGDAVFPYLFADRMEPLRIDLPLNCDTLVQIRLPSPVVFREPSQFFLGAVLRSTGVAVRMDRKKQSIACVRSSGDSLFTNMYAVQDPRAGGYVFGTGFENGKPVNNWYIEARGIETKISGPPGFRDVATSAGLSVETGRVRSLTWGDFNNDGFDDLLAGGKLFLNRANGSFTHHYTCADPSENGLDLFYDFDDDDDLDILSLPDGLLHINKEGELARITTQGPGPFLCVEDAAVADINRDWLPDLAVIGGTAPPEASEPCTRRLYIYLNQGNGSFLSLDVPQTRQEKQEGPYLHPAFLRWVDIRNDGVPDLFVGYAGESPNRLLACTERGVFDISAEFPGLTGTAGSASTVIHGYSRGCEVGDINNDGFPDFITSKYFEPYRLGYSHVTSMHLSSRQGKWYTRKPGPGYSQFRHGLAAGDCNNDGLPDLFLTSGEPCVSSALFLQRPDESFVDIAYESGVRIRGADRAAWVDYDNDGDLDLSVMTTQGIQLLNNELPNTGNWMDIILSDGGGGRMGGVRFEVHSGTKRIIRGTGFGSGLMSPASSRFHLGLGEALLIDSLLIHWSGRHHPEVIRSLNVNRRIVIRKNRTDSSTVFRYVPDSGASYRTSKYGTRLTYNLPETVWIRIDILDSRGNHIRRLANASQSAGIHFLDWDGTDEKGATAPTGRYQCIIRAGEKLLGRYTINIAGRATQ